MAQELAVRAPPCVPAAGLGGRRSQVQALQGRRRGGRGVRRGEHRAVIAVSLGESCGPDALTDGHAMHPHPPDARPAVAWQLQPRGGLHCEHGGGAHAQATPVSRSPACITHAAAGADATAMLSVLCLGTGRALGTAVQVTRRDCPPKPCLLFCRVWTNPCTIVGELRCASWQQEGLVLCGPVSERCC